ncbi:conjugative transposon protein TraJ [Chryseolinea lacunae]|uniref:Conjugative transposon protein TraJ n=1 Tax=Chryseolinea lacunae TaxID=2801331 RepID=A0ABS1KZL0_9BACT|nr:conjugative transposon protein TraJ [Chryseolinea lacunae]MBL0744864.1 conjugative transposon protein TraJ [Chryseolinea lacunae]
MKTIFLKVAALATAGLLLPKVSQAQTYSGEIHTLQSVLDQLYTDMLPLCDQLIGVGQGIGGFAALWYIGARVWRSIANAEAIDFYPLLRPFAIGLAIALFPYVISLMNGVLQPTVTGTGAMMTRSNDAIAYLLKQKEEAIKKTVLYQLFGDEATHGKWYRYANPDGDDEDPNLLSNGIQFLMTKTAYGIKNALKQWLSEILHILYEAAALCINTLRTFLLIVLAILGPLVFGLSIFDGLQNTLTVWIARYINVFLWLPVANIFGSIIAKIQENMLRIDLAQIDRYGDTFFSAADTGYLIFLIIGIVGYFTVPSVANYIVHAGGASTLLYKTSNLFSGAAISTASGARAAVKVLNTSSQENTASGQGSTHTRNDFMNDKLSGKK